VAAKIVEAAKGKNLRLVGSVLSKWEGQLAFETGVLALETGVFIYIYIYIYI